MVSPDPALVRLAEAVSDGTDVDWDHAESSAQTENERQAIRHLRSLAGLASAARTRIERWGSLQLRGEIGRGVFGVVYRAWDSRLEREVALKLLPSAAGPAGATAAIAEARLLARIRHPNVVTVFGADQADGFVGIWMELITGRTLRDIVSTYGPFGAPEAALIGRDLCRALAAVHQQGFVHRDVKAQNVMREAGGRTVLMDFGAGQALPDTPETSTILRGTPAYLAPEILEGQPPSVQSDLYALGVLLYFLVSGTFPVTATSFDEFRAMHRSGTRRLLRDARPDLPAAFVAVVDRCIAPDPAARPQSAGAVETLLNAALEAESDPQMGIGTRGPSKRSGWSLRRRIAAAAIGVFAIGMLGVGAWINASRQASPVRRDSVAILPLRNLTTGSDTAYFSEGITADLIGSLSALPELRVIAGSSMARYKDSERSPAEIGKELGVATVLDASIRRSNDTVRIVAQLIDAATGDPIWSDRFDGRVLDIIQMKSDVSHKIAVALRGELSQRDEEVLRVGSRYDPAAFDLYLKGHKQWLLGTEDSLTRSVQYFNEAVARDPSFALAYTGIADAYYRMGANGMLPRDEAYSRAVAAAEKAVQLDDSLAEAHASLAQARKNKFEWAAAERAFKRAIELKPGYSKAHHWYSVFLTQHARFAEALAEIRIALSLDPVSKEPRLQFAAVLAMMRRYDDALAQYEQALKMDGEFPLAYRHMARASVNKGDFARAGQLYAEARSRMPAGAEDQELNADLGYLYARSGRQQEALAIARDLTVRYERAGEAVAGSIAGIYAGLGRRQEALDWLEKAAAVRDAETGYLKVDPVWDALRGEPRFAALLNKLGFTH